MNQQQLDYYIAVAIVTAPITIFVVAISIVFWLLRPSKDEEADIFKYDDEKDKSQPLN